MKIVSVPDFPDYTISDSGVVWNKFGTKVGNTLPNGRMKVSLRKSGKSHSFYVHSLVLLAFVGPRPEGHEACHNNGDLTNNRLSNLRWDTHENNMRDKAKHGTHNNSKKTHCPRGHLLAEPNLNVAALRRGQRSCKACATARITLKRKSMYNEENMQVWSDDYYSQSSVAHVSHT